MRHLVLGFIALLWVATEAATAEPRPGPERDSPSHAESAAVLASDPVLQASLDRLWHGSASWREAMREIGLTGRRALVLTPNQVVVREDVSATGQAEAFDPTLLGAVSPVAGADGRLTAVLVVINLPLIQAVHERRGSLPGELQSDIDRIMAHEVFGHAVPYLLDGTLAGRCADPEPGQRAADACSIQRENIVRRELGLSRRTDAGLNGLALAYRGRD